MQWRGYRPGGDAAQQISAENQAAAEAHGCTRRYFFWSVGCNSLCEVLSFGCGSVAGDEFTGFVRFQSIGQGVINRF